MDKKRKTSCKDALNWQETVEDLGPFIDVPNKSEVSKFKAAMIQHSSNTVVRFVNMKKEMFR